MSKLEKKLINGDKETFIQLIRPLEKKLYVIAKSKIDSEEDVKDVIQETLLSGYKNINKLNTIENFEAWIIMILLNNCNKYYKSKKHITLVSLHENEEVADLDNEYSKIDKSIEFYEYLNQLDDEEKTLFILYYSEEMTTKKIADVTNQNENTIKTKLGRCRQKIQKYVERWDEHGN